MDWYDPIKDKKQKSYGKIFGFVNNVVITFIILFFLLGLYHTMDYL